MKTAKNTMALTIQPRGVPAPATVQSSVYVNIFNKADGKIAPASREDILMAQRIHTENTKVIQAINHLIDKLSTSAFFLL